MLTSRHHRTVHVDAAAINHNILDDTNLKNFWSTSIVEVFMCVIFDEHVATHVNFKFELTLQLCACLQYKYFYMHK